MRDLRDRLQMCTKLLPELESLQNKLHLHETRVLPLLVALRTGRQLSAALQAMATACSTEDWFVYLADENSYLPAQKRDSPSSAPAAANLFTPAGNPAVGDSLLPPEFPNRRLPQSIDRQEVLISAGYTPLVPAQPYERVREIASRLNQGNSFAGVDILPESMRVIREDIFSPWMAFCKKIPRRQFKAFTFRMPLLQESAATQDKNQDDQ